MSLADDATLDARPHVIAILRSGVRAADMCRRGAHGEVAAVFDRSFYLRAGDAFLCVGQNGIGNGPLTLIADSVGAVRWSDLGLRPGQRADISVRHIVVGNAVRFGLADCEVWRPPGWPVPLPDARLIASCTALAHRAAVEAPSEGLARVVFGARIPIAHTPFSGIARERIAGFESWLSALARDQAPWSPAYIRDLIGLGPGLTPSGDDFLSGALALLDALALRKIHAMLAQATIALAPALTSPLSACFLKAAVDGHIGEHLHGAVAALILGDIDTAVAAACRVGHSSGWDALAGAATTLRIVAQSPAARMESASERT